MRYIKTYEQLNYSDEINAIELKYKTKLSDCILYLSDVYDVKSNSDEGTFWFYWDIKMDDDQEILIDLINRSAEKIRYELNGDCSINLRKCNSLTTYTTADEHATDQPIDRLRKLFSLDMFSLKNINQRLVITLNIY